MRGGGSMICDECGEVASGCCEARERVRLASAGPPELPQTSVERNAQRVLAAVYRLTRGDTRTAVPESEILAEVEREALLDLSDEQFEKYRRAVLAEVTVHRAIGWLRVT